MLGVLTGAIGGGLSAPAVVAFGADLHPIASSALAWALAGSVVGLLGCHLARWARLPEPPEEEPVPAPAPHRIEWLLHQQERRLSDWPLFHVLPILVASALALVGAVVLATSDRGLALAAVGVLGLAVALVVHVQGVHLRNLEARLRKLEHQSRPAPEDDAG